MHAYTGPQMHTPSCRRRVATHCLAVAVLLCAATPAWTQQATGSSENVRFEYAQVLRAEPVYQTLRATRMEQQCDGRTIPPASPPKGLSRIVGAVKDVLKPGEKTPEVEEGDCRIVPVEREFRRPIAYDVDYVYKGSKYRSRLPYDPGNRLKVRVSVTPFAGPATP